MQRSISHESLNSEPDIQIKLAQEKESHRLKELADKYKKLDQQKDLSLKAIDRLCSHFNNNPFMPQEGEIETPTPTHTHESAAETGGMDEATSLLSSEQKSGEIYPESSSRSSILITTTSDNDDLLDEDGFLSEELKKLNQLLRTNLKVFANELTKAYESAPQTDNYYNYFDGVFDAIHDLKTEFTCADSSVVRQLKKFGSLQIAADNYPASFALKAGASGISIFSGVVVSAAYALTSGVRKSVSQLCKSFVRSIKNAWNDLAASSCCAAMFMLVPQLFIRVPFATVLGGLKGLFSGAAEGAVQGFKRGFSDTYDEITGRYSGLTIAAGQLNTTANKICKFKTEAVQADVAVTSAPPVEEQRSSMGPQERPGLVLSPVALSTPTFSSLQLQAGTFSSGGAKAVALRAGAAASALASSSPVAGGSQSIVDGVIPGDAVALSPTVSATSLSLRGHSSGSIFPRATITAATVAPGVATTASLSAPASLAATASEPATRPIDGSNSVRFMV